MRDKIINIVSASLSYHSGEDDVIGISESGKLYRYYNYEGDVKWILLLDSPELPVTSSSEGGGEL
jgi:hypothetical protein